MPQPLPPPLPMAELIGDAVARGSFVVESPDRTLDCRAFDLLSHAIADRLLAEGAVIGEAVIVVIRNRAADLAAYYGAWRAGLVAVPVHVSSPEPVVQSLTTRVGARLRVDDGEVSLIEGSAAPRVLDTELAFIIYTSGSTGAPKGVALRHAPFAEKIGTIARHVGLTAEDVAVMPLQLTFVMGMWASIVPMVAGAHLRLVPKFSAALMNAAIADGATVATAVPSMFRTMLDAPVRYPAPLRIWFTGGEPLGDGLGRRVIDASPQARIIDMYGSTETNACDFCFDSAAQPEGFGTIGRPMEGVAYLIADPEGHAVPEGTEGELRIRTPFAMARYHDDAALTEGAFAHGYYRTGDVARLRSDGLVELTGRIKDLISRGGNKIAPLELDFLFSGHPDIQAAVCAGIADLRLGESIHLMAVPRKGSELTADSLRAWASERIERFKIPDVIHFVDELPVGRTGKADRLAVRRRAEELLAREA